MLLAIIFSSLTAHAGLLEIDCELALRAPRGLKRFAVALSSEGDANDLDDAADELRVTMARLKPGNLKYIAYIENMLRQPLDPGPDDVTLSEVYLAYMLRSPKFIVRHIPAFTSALLTAFVGYDGESFLEESVAKHEDAFRALLAAAKQDPDTAALAWQESFATIIKARDLQFPPQISANAAEWREVRGEPGYEEPRDLLTSLAPAHYFGVSESVDAWLDIARKFNTQDADRPLEDLAKLDYSTPHDFEMDLVKLEELIFWARVNLRLAQIAPAIRGMPFNAFVHQMREDFQTSPLQSPKLIDREELRLRQSRTRKLARLSDWQNEKVNAGEESNYRRWIYFGRPDFALYGEILDAQEALSLRYIHPSAGAPTIPKEPAELRAFLIALYPKDSPAYLALTLNAGKNTASIEGENRLSTPNSLRRAWPQAPLLLLFSVAEHYDEHIWERAERARKGTAVMARTAPEYIAHQMQQLIGERNISEVIEALTQIKAGLSRENFETTAWSVSKRNYLLENIERATWKVLEGKASVAENTLLQAEFKGTRYNLAVNTKTGKIASIYPVCGPGVFLIPRTSKITRAITMLKQSEFKLNKDLREGLLKEKPCPSN